MERTPVVGKLPRLLQRFVMPPRTPHVGGVPVPQMRDMLRDTNYTEPQIKAAVEMAGAEPGADPLWEEADRELLRSSCSYFAHHTLTGPKSAPYNGRFLIGPHHLEWDDLASKHNRVCVMAARDHGKCSTSRHLVQAADGRRVPITEWKGGKVIAYDAETWRLVPSEASASSPMGVQKCVRVRTRTGRVEEVSLNHRFAVVDGWVHARDLQPGLRIAVPLEMPVFGNKPLREGEAWLIAFLLGDGGLTNGVRFSKYDQVLVEQCRTVVSWWGWRVTDRQAKGQYGIAGAGPAVSRPPEWARKFGLLGCAAAQKKIPEAIFTATYADVCDFLAGCLDTDAHVNVHGGGSVEFASTSEELMRGVQHLLMRLGVVSVLNQKVSTYNEAPYTSWRLTVRGRSICRLAEQVSPRSDIRRTALVQLAREQATKAEGGTVDLIPADVCDWLEFSSGWTRRHGGPGFYRDYDMTRTKALAIADLQSNSRLRRLAEASVLWDEVVEVEDIGEHETYAITVPKYEAYVGSDIINHNSFYWTLAYPIWKAGYVTPGSTGMLFSATQPQAERLLGMIKHEILTNPKLSHLVPYTGERFWSAKRIRLRNGSTIVAAGFGVRVRGAHPEFVVCDDVLNDDDIYSETIRQRNIDYFLSAIAGMVHRSKQLMLVGTPLHQGDLYQAVRSTGQYTYREYPALKAGNPLWPARYTLEDLQAKRAELKSEARFAREFLCCRPGTMIETDMGPVPIERIAVGTRVLTHTGAFRRVVQTFQHEHKGELIRVKGLLHVTPNHPVWTPDGFVPAGGLVLGDCVTFPRPVVEGRVISAIDLAAGTTVPFLRTKDRSRIYARGSSSHLKSGSVGNSGSKSVPERIPFTRELMRLFGLYLAEGFTGAQGQVVLTFGYGERDTLAKEAAALIHRIFGLRASLKVDRAKGSAVVCVGCRLLADYLDRTFGHGAWAKRVPSEWRTLDPTLLWELVLGYVDGDGHVDSGMTMRVSSVSKLLLHDIQFLLARCGLFSTLSCQHAGGPGIVQGRAVTLRPSWRLAVDGGACAAFRSRQFPVREHQWGRVHTSLQAVPYAGLVHNFEVEVDNSYVADGVAVHNCKPLSDEASLFPARLFEASGVRQPYRLGQPAAYWNSLGYARYTGVDIALSAEVGADYFVIFTIAVDLNGNYWLANMRRHRGMAFSAQIELIKEEYQLMQPDMVYIEANQAQRVWTDELVRTTNIPVTRFFTTGIGGAQPLNGWRKGATSVAVNKHHIDRGVPGMRMHLEHGKWRIPRGDAYSIEMTDAWIGEMGMMGWVNGKVRSVGEHDDTVMASWIASSAAQRGSGGAAFDNLLGTDNTLGDLVEMQKRAEAAKVPSTAVTKELHDSVFIRLEAQVPVEVDSASYAAGIRTDMQRHAGILIDNGNELQAVHVLQEVARLDALHAYSEAGRRGDVASGQGAGYGAPSWRPAEGSPRVSDLGYDE